MVFMGNIRQHRLPMLKKIEFKPQVKSKWNVCAKVLDKALIGRLTIGWS